MKLPTKEPRSFVLDLREALMGSMGQREKDAKSWDSLYYAGTTPDKDTPAIANVITNIVNTESGNLFSPDRLTFRLEYEFDMDDDVLAKAARAGSYLSRELRECDADLEFGDAVQLALRHGAAFGQVIPDTDGGLACDVIQGSSVGVLNEKAKSLDDQPAFMVSYTIPVEDLAGMLRKLRGTEDIAGAFDKRDGDQALEANEATKVILGLNQPIGSASASQAGFINLLPRPPYVPSANSKGRQVPVDAIWLQRDDGRWASVWVIDGNDTVGTDQWRNFLALGDDGHENEQLAKRHPYFYVCPYPVKGSFFGRSRIADLAESQAFVRRHTNNLDHILNMQSDPSHVGFGAINSPDVYKQLFRSPGGFQQEAGPNAKITPFAPEMPPNMLEYIESATQWAAAAANKPPVSQGRGESGVRAGAHAETLLTAASAAERRPALRTVRQCGDMGDLALDILRVKDAVSLPDGQGGTFQLESLVSDFHVYCNGHSASPLFAAEFRSMVLELFQAKAIGPEQVLDMLNPEGHDMLLSALKKGQQQQQQLVQSLPPEDKTKLLVHSGGKK